MGGKILVVEIKGEDFDKNRAKRDALDFWVKAVNKRSGFGTWCWDVAFSPTQVDEILARAINL